MNTITFISTIHKKFGQCNADELCDILKVENPEVIFLEALDATYSKYEETNFSEFGVFHQKLEIEAIQKLSKQISIKYIPVLDTGLSDSFDKKYERISENQQIQKMLDEFNSLVRIKGFPFLNSELSMSLHQKMRMVENQSLNDDELKETFNSDIDAYENSMMENIAAFCRINRFDKAVFLCGSAHRESLIEKISHFKKKDKMNLNWIIYGEKTEHNKSNRCATH